MSTLPSWFQNSEVLASAWMSASELDALISGLHSAQWCEHSPPNVLGEFDAMRRHACLGNGRAPALHAVQISQGHRLTPLLCLLNAALMALISEAATLRRPAVLDGLSPWAVIGRLPAAVAALAKAH